MQQQISDAAVTTIKAVPPVAATLWTFAGLTMEQWISSLTLLWLLMLLAEKAAKWVMAWKRMRNP